MNNNSKYENRLADKVFLGYCFSGEQYANADSGMQIAVSEDGRVFKNIADTPEPLYTADGGIRDPYLLYKNGSWYAAYTYGENISPVMFLAKSKDLKNWTQICALRLDKDIPGGNNYVDVPSWIIDTDGQIHVIACVDHNHHWVEIHPLNDDPETWRSITNWSSVTEITDCAGGVLIQGNSWVCVKDNIYYMCYNDLHNKTAYMRTSKNLVSGWSHPRKLDIGMELNCIETVGLTVIPDGVFRFYISCGNELQYKQWHIDSTDNGFTWSSPVLIECRGFNHRVNWIEVACITNHDAIVSLRESGLLNLL